MICRALIIPPPMVTAPPPQQNAVNKFNVLPPNASTLVICATKICLEDPKLFGLLMTIAGVSHRQYPGRLRLFAASLTIIALGLFVSVGLVASKRGLGLTVSTLGVYFFLNNFKRHPEPSPSAPSSTAPQIKSSVTTATSETSYSQLPVELQEHRPFSQANSKINIDEE